METKKQLAILLFFFVGSLFLERYLGIRGLSLWSAFLIGTMVTKKTIWVSTLAVLIDLFTGRTLGFSLVALALVFFVYEYRPAFFSPKASSVALVSIFAILVSLGATQYVPFFLLLHGVSALIAYLAVPSMERKPFQVIT